MVQLHKLFYDNVLEHIQDAINFKTSCLNDLDELVKLLEKKIQHIIRQSLNVIASNLEAILSNYQKKSDFNFKEDDMG